MKLALFITIIFLCAIHLTAQISFHDGTNSTLYRYLFQPPAPNSEFVVGVVDIDGNDLDDIIFFNHDPEVCKKYVTNNRSYFAIPAQLFIAYQQKMVKVPYNPTGPITPAFIPFTIKKIIDDLPLPKGMTIGDIDNNGSKEIIIGGAGDWVRIIDISGAQPSVEILPTQDFFREFVLQGVNFHDMNFDGNLDLFAANDIHENSALTFSQSTNKLEINTQIFNFASNPTFCPSLGVANYYDPNSGNYGTVWSDIDNDGISEVYISKCRGGVIDPASSCRINQLYKYDQAQNKYIESAAFFNLDLNAQSWAADFGDFDNDADLDCIVINHDNQDANLLRNDLSPNWFTDISNSLSVPITGISNPYQTFFEDFDNDGLVDILVTANLEASLYKNTSSNLNSPTPSISFDKIGSFLLSETLQQEQSLQTFRSAAIGDLNDDGFPDIYAEYKNGKNRLFLNSKNSNNFLKVK